MAVRSPTAWSGAPVTVTVRGVAQSPSAPPVKVSDAGLTPRPVGGSTADDRRTAPAGCVSSTTVKTARLSSAAVVSSSASATASACWAPGVPASVSTVTPYSSSRTLTARRALAPA